MSQAYGYSRFVDEEGGQGNRLNRQDEDLDNICSKISEDVTRIKSNVGSFDKLLQLLGSPREPASLRSQISSTQQHTSVLIKSVNDQFRLASELRRSARDRNVQFRLDRLQADFKSVVQTYQRLQTDILNKMKVTQAAGNAGGASSSSQAAGGYGATESQQQLAGQTGSRQISAQLAREDDLIITQQREAELARLEQDMVAVHEIFKDLSTMVYEQGQVVDSIESHVEQASVHVEQGQGQLARAVQHKRSYRRNCCILWTILTFVVVLIVIIVVLQLKH